MLQKIKTNALVPSLLISILLVGGIWGFASYKGVQTNMELITLQGSSDVLDAIQLNGQIYDGYHQKNFSLINNKIYSSTKVRTSFQPISPSRTGILFPFKEVGEYAVTVEKHNASFNHYVVFHQLKKDYYRPVVTVPVYIPARSSPHSPSNLSFTLSEQNGATNIGDNYYFTLPLTSDFSGENGIYKLNVARQAEEEFLGLDSQTEAAKSPPIVTFTMNTESTEADTGINVLGLEAIDNKLMLILMKDDTLFFRFYTEDGAFAGEQQLDYIESRMKSSLEDEHNYYYNNRRFPDYTAFRDDQLQQLTLSFQLGSKFLFVTLNASEQPDIIDITETDLLKKGERLDGFTNHSIYNARYLDRKLYILASIRELTTEDYSTQYIELRQNNKLRLTVYDNGDLTYEGELKSDINDDRIHWNNFTESGYSLHEAKHRRFAQLSIQPLQKGASKHD